MTLSAALIISVSVAGVRSLGIPQFYQYVSGGLICFCQHRVAELGFFLGYLLSLFFDEASSLSRKSAMTFRRRWEMYGLLILLLLSVSLAFANPKSTTFNASPDDVFKAAKKAAAGHHIVIPKDEGLKTLTDSGEEVRSFQFTTSLPGVTFRVIEEISVEPLPDGTTKLEVMFYNDRPYVPSESLELREQQLHNQLELKLSALEQEQDENKRQYEDYHTIDIQTYTTKWTEILALEHEAKLEGIEQEREAKIADLAGMPTSSFSTMDAASDKFLGLVQRNLQGGKEKPTVGADH